MKKLRLLAKENSTKIKSYGRTIAVDDNQLMFNGSVKFYWLKRKLKIFNYLKDYDYFEKYKLGTETLVVCGGDPNNEKSFLFLVVHDPYTEYIGIYLKLYSQGYEESDDDAKNLRSFDMYRNLYVTKHFKEFVCVWTRLALEYENF